MPVNAFSLVMAPAGCMPGISAVAVRPLLELLHYPSA